jgi:LacI family transcriptional regulator
VVLDNVRIGRIGAEHLLQRGFRSLAFLKCTDYTDIRGREAGFAAAVHEAGVRYDCLDWHAASRRKPQGDLQSWLGKRLLKLPRPLGVMAQSDHRAYSLIDACQSAGLAVPEQVAVVGVDNDAYTCEFAPVPITSVESSREELAYRGAELLDRLMQGESPPSEPLLIPPGGLVLRQSSDILAIDHPEVAKALSFVWKYHGQRIGVDDVVAATTMSRCGLYRAFERYVGRTIRQELERTRIEHGQRLLLTTSDSVSRIARLCGFGSGEQFCRVFTANLGVTPRDFRRQSESETRGKQRARRPDQGSL